ncbi:LysR substrate-binding domain-containing protein [Sphingopyxis sp.]|uniref:LysR substrate-binding domain-containing protein n=1 Tax=Sphingopyxis sp. TaxID=1908224 RepID=UPI003D6C9B69
MAALDQAKILELPEGLPIRPLPPLTAVRAFEAAARLQSFTRAAEELSMTPAAISYQIKQLEARLGLTLFRRLPRKVILTAAGEQLAPSVAEAFKLLQGAFSTVAERADGELAITALPTIASSWLVPRLGQFQKRQSDLHIRLDTSVPLVDLNLGAFDVSIRSGSGSWPTMDAHFLLPDSYTPLISPALAASTGGIRTPRDLQGRRLLGRASVWKDWFDQVGAAAVAPSTQAGMDFGIEHYDVTAAIAGEGIAMASPLLFAEEIKRGQLVQPFPQTVQPTDGYWLAYPSANARAAKIRAFTRWLLTEARTALEAYPRPAIASAIPAG